MFAKLNQRQVPPEKLDDVLRVYRGTVAPNRKAQKGNKGAFVLTNRTAGKVVAISLWETEADMNAAEGNVPPDVDAAGAGERIVETYEVSIEP
jgi:heme-degrading monooxygenase HmoA